MTQFQRFLRDDSGTAILEYSLTFALFGFAAFLGMMGMYMQTQSSLTNTRANLICNSVTFRSNAVATTDAAGNVTCQ